MDNVSRNPVKELGKLVSLLIVIGSSTLLLSACPAPAPTPPDPILGLDEITAAHFARHIGTTFTIDRESGPVKAELIEVAVLKFSGERPAEVKREHAFVAVLESDQAIDLDHDTHGILHDELGDIDLFLVPVPRAGGDHTIEAIFN